MTKLVGEHRLVCKRKVIVYKNTYKSYRRNATEPEKFSGEMRKLGLEKLIPSSQHEILSKYKVF